MLRQARIMIFGLAGAIAFGAVIWLLDYARRRFGVWVAVAPLGVMFIYCLGQMIEMYLALRKRKG